MPLLKKKAKVELTEKKPEEYDIKSRPDRVSIFFRTYTEAFIFTELQDEFLQRAGNLEFMRGIPVPLRREDVAEFDKDAGLKLPVLCENMARIIGIDPKFPHRDAYMAFMEKLFPKKLAMYLVKEGRDEAEKKDYDHGAIHFRAALCFDPTNLHAMYSYARVCRELYLAGEEEAYIGCFKAESMEYFELIVSIHPNFAQAYYFLGYAYLNLGLYVKAQIAWEQYLAKGKIMKDRQEIKKRLAQIADPVQIEKGYNAVLAGRYEEGIGILERYLESSFRDWWPMSYYLGIAYHALGEISEAISSFTHVLTLNASHVESMDELGKIYGEIGNQEKEKKYRKKAMLIRSGGYDDN